MVIDKTDSLRDAQNRLQLVKEISDIFNWFYRNNYITARDGNCCIRLDKNDFLITASGVNKHRMDCHDFVRVDQYGDKLKTQEGRGVSRKESIETKAHVFSLKNAGKGVSIHVHPPKTVALFSALTRNSDLMFELDQWPELHRYTKVGSPIKSLEPGSKELHLSLAEAFREEGVNIVPMKFHGVMAVGSTLEECKEHIIRLEHISSMMIDLLSVRGSI